MAITEQLRLDLTEALRQVDDLERQLDSLLQPITIPVNLQGEQALEGLRSQIRATEAEDVDLDVNVDGIEKAEDQFEDLRKDIDKTEDSLEDVERQSRDTEDAMLRVGTRGVSAFTNLRGSLLGVGAAFAAFQGLKGAIGLMGDAVEAASDLEESTSKASVVFGEFNEDIEAFAQTAPQALGLSRQAALEATATFGNLFVALGLSKGAAAELAPEIVQLGTDLASFNNIEVAEAIDKLRSGLVGEVEPLRALGVNLNAAVVEAKALELGLQDANGVVSEAAKVQARYKLILEQTGTAQGDFARTADGLANTQRSITAEWQNAQAELGKGLIPLLEAGLPAVRGLIGAFTDLAQSVGVATGSMTAAEEELADLLETTGQAAGSAELLAGAAVLLGEEFERLDTSELDRGREGASALKDEVLDLVDAWGGNEAEIRKVIDNLDVLREEFGLSEEVADELAVALGDRLAQAGLKLSDEVLRARVQNELKRTRQATIDARIEAENYEAAFASSRFGQVTRRADQLEAEADALAQLRAAADEAGIGLGELLLDIEALPPELQTAIGLIRDATLEVISTEGIDRFVTELEELPNAMEAAGRAFEDETGEIEDDFSDFLDNLTQQLADQRAFETNLDILRAFGLDKLAEVFESEGIKAAGLLADAIANPDEAARAEAELERDYTQITEDLAETMAGVFEGNPPTRALIAALETALADAEPSVREAILAFARANPLQIESIVLPPTIPPHFLEGIDVGTVTIPSQVSAPSGGTSGSPNLPQAQTSGVNVTINNPSTNDLQSDAARAGQEIGAVVRNLPQ